MFNSLRTRLLAAFLAIILVGVGGVTAWAAIQMSQATYADYGANVQAQAVQLASELSEPLEYNDTIRALKLMTLAANNLSGQAALFTAAGDFVGSTDGSESDLLAQDAFLYERDEGGIQNIYASAAISHDDKTMGIVQLSTTSSVPATAARQRTLGLTTSFVVVSVVGIVMALWLSASMTRPLSALRDSALAMSQGDLTTRIEQTAHDEIGAVGTAFNEMAERVEAMLTEQRAFASNASHELRTPLTTIRLRTEALQDYPDDPERTALYIDEIDAEAKRMSNLVDDLLLLSRLDAKRLMAGRETIDVVRLMQVLQVEFGRKAHEKQIDLTVSLPEETDVTVEANQSHLRVVVGNVIGNAIKYTQAGGQVSVRLNQLQNTLQLMVTDNGPGISDEDMPNIGKRFFRADKAHSREIPGTGLGLALVVRILELYQGEFEIESQGAGLGTVVTVCWPRPG